MLKRANEDYLHVPEYTNTSHIKYYLKFKIKLPIYLSASVHNQTMIRP